MSIFVTLDPARHITGCYPDDMFSEETRLDDAIEITEEVWREWLSDQTKVLSADGSCMDAATVALDDVKVAKIIALTAACAAAIVGGYESRALDSAYTYPSNVTDQMNMIGSVTASLLPGLAADWSTPFWCADVSGQWAFRLHSAAQIQMAGSDGKAHVVTCQATLEQLTAAVSQSPTAEMVEAVTRPST
ncbi:hypothetical protein ACQZ6F_17440 [Rhizobium sp. A22-96]